MGIELGEGTDRKEHVPRAVTPEEIVESAIEFDFLVADGLLNIGAQPMGTLR